MSDIVKEKEKSAITLKQQIVPILYKFCFDLYYTNTNTIAVIM